MDEGDGVTPEAVKELRRATDLALRAKKHTSQAVGCSMAGLVTAKCHLWLNLTEKEKAFLLDAPISSSGLFGDAVNAAVDKFMAAKTQSAAFKQLMPRHARKPASASSSRERLAPSEEPVSRVSEPMHPQPYTVWGARGRSASRQRPRKRMDLKRPNKPPAVASTGRHGRSSYSISFQLELKTLPPWETTLRLSLLEGTRTMFPMVDIV